METIRYIAVALWFGLGLVLIWSQNDYVSNVLRRSGLRAMQEGLDPNLSTLSNWLFLGWGIAVNFIVFNIIYQILLPGPMAWPWWWMPILLFISVYAWLAMIFVVAALLGVFGLRIWLAPWLVLVGLIGLGIYLYSVGVLRRE